MDYDFLRGEGIRQLERMTGGQWTDFKAHDPGITLLEQLCYALSDLGYRTGYEIPDLLADGGGDPIRWSYLSGDRFIPLDGRILSDTTRGLINSGIVELALEPAAPNTRLRGDLYWIRAAVERDTSTFCDTLAVHTQAVSATFVNHDNAPDHFREPLPAGTITSWSSIFSSTKILGSRSGARGDVSTAR